jgi:hypothetical protein
VNYPNSPFCRSFVDIGSDGRDSPRFERKTPTRYDALQQHKAIEFRQRFLALPCEIRIQIYREIVFNHPDHQSQVSHYHFSTGTYVYTQIDGGMRPDGTLIFRSEYPQPDHLHYIRKGGPMWQELFDVWLAHAECELSHVFDLNFNNYAKTHLESVNGLYLGSPHHSTLSLTAHPHPLLARQLRSIARCSIRTCKLNLALYGVDFDFVHAAKSLYTSPLYTTVSQTAHSLMQILKTSNLRIEISFWPGKYMEYSDHGWSPYFESDADVEGLWTLLKPFKEVPGIQSVRANRLRGSTLWSRHPNSLYPENPPLVVVEQAGVSVDGWLGLDKGDRTDLVGAEV